MRKWLACLIIMLLAVSTMAVDFATAESISEEIVVSEQDEWEMDYGSFMDLTRPEDYAMMRYIQDLYPQGSQWKDGGQCYGYAVKVNSILGQRNKVKDFVNLHGDYSVMEEKLRGLKPGTHIRFSSEGKFNPYLGHSIVVLGVGKEYVYWADNNGSAGNDKVGYNMDRLDSFYVAYLNRITEPTALKAFSEPRAYCFQNMDGQVTLSWLKTKGSKSYNIYRAEAKDGEYIKVGSTKKRYFVDKTAGFDKEYFYKVEAVRSRGNVYGKIATFKATVPTPKEVYQEAILGTKDAKITWKAIDGINKYRVYRKLDYSEEYQLCGEVSGNEYIDKGIGDTMFSDIYYTVCAVADTGQRSKFAKVFFMKSIKLLKISQGENRYWCASASLPQIRTNDIGVN